MTDRRAFEKRTILLRGEQQRERAIALLKNVPLDADKPLEVVVRYPEKARKLDQQALLFAGPLRDISQQAWFEGRQHSVEVIHEYLKRELLPEEYDPDQCLDGYKKWQIDPGGNRVLVGSTKKLTILGYSNYLEGVFAFGSALGVEFTASPNERKP